MKTIWLGVLLGIFGTIQPRLLAELPPSVYEQKQKAAPEKLQLQIMRVEVEPATKPEDQTVRLTALVDQVDRTVTGIKSGDFITVTYTIVGHPPGWVGPGPVPIPNEKDKTVAYLQQVPDTGDYAPAAGAMTFSNF